jgi:crossover junction endodeoxyribonuclease RusA
MTILTLPLPPSVNSYWRAVMVRDSRAPRAIFGAPSYRQKVLISKRGRDWRKAALQAIARQGPRAVPGEFAVEITVYFRDNRGDLDNRLKPILDILQAARLIENDRLARDIVLRWAIDTKAPRVLVELRPYARAAA